MSDALLTRIAEGIEKLIHLHGSAPKATKTKPAAEPAATPTSAGAAAPVADPALQIPPTQTAAPALAAPAAALASAGDLLTQTANAVIDLANNYSRDAAVAAMGKYGINGGLAVPGSNPPAQKVSQIKPQDLQALLNDTYAAIAQEKAKKANESLV
jgi:hypothetical protein